DIRSPRPAGSYAGYRSDVNGTVFFAADDGVHGTELWKSDGTAAGTVLVKDIFPGWQGSGPSNLTNVNGTLFFTANMRELWKSDGTAAGTVLLKDTGSGYLALRNFTNVNGTMFFTNDTDYYTHGTELWRSDGTAAGTTIVAHLHRGYFNYGRYYFQSAYAGNLTNVNGTLFFTARVGSEDGGELFKSDGTAAGTV